MREVTFINFTLKFPSELYHDTELPELPQLIQWSEELAKSNLIKFGFSYNPDRSSFIVSYTDRGGKTKDPDTCTTAFGSTLLSAYQKLYVVVEILGLRREGEERARDRQDEIETYISVQLKKAMNK